MAAPKKAAAAGRSIDSLSSTLPPPINTLNGKCVWPYKILSMGLKAASADTKIAAMYTVLNNLYKQYSKQQSQQQQSQSP